MSNFIWTGCNESRSLRPSIPLCSLSRNDPRQRRSHSIPRSQQRTFNSLQLVTYLLFNLTYSIMTAGCGLLATVTPDTPARAMGLTFFAGIGTGGLLLPAATVLTIISPDEVIATITAATVSIRLVGASIGYSVYFNVLENKLATLLPTDVATAVAEAGLAESQIPDFLGAFLGSNSTALAGYNTTILYAAEMGLKTAYTAAFKTVYLVAIAFGIPAVICCLFLGDIRKYMVDRIAVDIH